MFSGKRKESLMNRQLWIAVAVLASAVLSSMADRAAAQHAVEVISYDAGHAPAAGYTNPAVALGSPERFTGEGVFPSVVSPFNPPFLSSELVSIGEGGQLTLRLSHYAIPQAGAPEIGLFSNVGLIDVAYPSGMAGSPAATFGFDAAGVEVSENGVDWVFAEFIDFNLPTNGFTDLSDPYSPMPGSVPSDFQQPFVGTLSDFDGLNYTDLLGPDILDLLAGSGGGNWIDVSATGLARVGYVRVSVPIDLDPIDSHLELDAVSISHAALGPPTVPEPATLTLCGLILLCPWTRRRYSGRA
jgi:hypothetical protein